MCKFSHNDSILEHTYANSFTPNNGNTWGKPCVSKCPWLVPTPQGVPECELTFLWLVLDVDSSLVI